MGAFDYEKSKEEKVADTTRNERTSKNTVYLSEYGKYTTASRGFIANILNRPVYTYTKLREDIYYIHCRLFTENDSLNYIFVVNEKSFWKRFTVLHNGIKIIKDNGISVRDMLRNCMIRPNEYQIQLNIYKFESVELTGCTSDNDKLKFFKNATLVKFTTYRCKNKRLWLNYLANGSGLVGPALAELGEPGDSKYENNGGKFDITSDKYKKYAFFID